MIEGQSDVIAKLNQQLFEHKASLAAEQSAHASTREYAATLAAQLEEQLSVNTGLVTELSTLQGSTEESLELKIHVGVVLSLSC